MMWDGGLGGNVCCMWGWLVMCSICVGCVVVKKGAKVLAKCMYSGCSFIVFFMK